MTFSQWLIGNGFTASAEEEQKLNPKALEKLKAQWEADEKASNPDPSPHGKDFAAQLAAERKEKERIDAIDEIGAAALKRAPDKMDMIERVVKAAHADRNTDPLKVELELWKLTAKADASNIPDGDRGVSSRVIEAAICKSLGVASIEKHYDARTLEATDQHFRHGIGLQQILFKAARANGQQFDSVGNLRGLLRAAFGGEGIQASAFSTISLPGILSNVMNKVLEDHFRFVEDTWRQITAIRTVTDFKQITSYSLTSDLTYEKVGPAGEIKHGTLGETTYSNKAETFAKMLGITRQDIINDDLGALQQIPAKLGRGGALAINNVFWAEFLNNSTFFHTDYGNVSTGGGSALGTSDGAAINAAEQKFLAMTDPTGKPMGTMPAIMLVPSTLLNTAARWMGGQQIVTGSDTVLPSANVYQGRYRVVSSRYMENSSFTGYSNAAWYLLADPRDVPVIQTVFLNGRDMPTIESADADFNTLGIQVRAYHDFGVAKQEPRGGVRSAGS